MPLTLPQGYYAQPVDSAGAVLLDAPRVTDYRFDVLDNEENLVGRLYGVEPGAGSLSWDAYGAIKGGGKLRVTDFREEIDWLNARLRIVALLEQAGGRGRIEQGLGVFLCTAPDEDWDDRQRQWDVDLHDKNAVLDQDIVVDAAGNPIAFTAKAGQNIIDVVRGLIEQAGETTPAFEVGTAVVKDDLTWPPATTRLKIINDLLDTGGYASLWVDGLGQYQAKPWIPPADRAPVYDLLAPFAPGGLMDNQWSRGRDYFGIPNRYVCIGQGTAEEEGLVGVATNVDPKSPFSQPSRGRWITQTDTGVEAASQADIDAIAKRRLLASDSVTNTFEVSHIFLPDLLVNSVVRFTNPDADVDLPCTDLKLEVPLDATGLCKSYLREVK